MLVAAQRPGTSAHLSQAKPEGQRIHTITGGSLHLEVGAAELPAALAGMKRVHVAGHGDAELYGKRTLAWVKDGRVELVDSETLAGLQLLERPVQVAWLIGCLIGGLVHWLIGGSVGRLVGWLSVGWLIGWLVGWFID